MSSWLYSPEGVLERPVQATRWIVPDVVELDRKHLYWKIRYVEGDEDKPDEDGKFIELNKEIGPSRGMLERFVALDSTDTGKILAFARRWGILDVKRARARVAGLLSHVGLSGFFQCPNELAVPTRRWYTAGNEFGVSSSRDVDPETADVYGREPLYVWRHWIRKFSASIRIASALVVPECPNQKDWELLLDLPDLSNFRPRRVLLQKGLTDETPGLLPLSREEQQWLVWRECRPQFFDVGLSRLHLQLTLSQWQRIAGVNLTIDQMTNQLSIETRCLFAGLVWQILAASCTSAGMSVCSGCGKTYSPSRLPAAGTRHYCPTCRKAGVPQRDAVRDHRKRLKEKSNHGKKTRKQ
jgi:hypothetical protein